MTGPEVDEGLLHGRGQAFGFLVAVRREHIETKHHIGLLQLFRGPEAGAVDLERL